MNRTDLFIKLLHITVASAKDKLLRKIDHMRLLLTSDRSWNEGCKAGVGLQQPTFLTAESRIKHWKGFYLMKESEKLKNNLRGQRILFIKRKGSTGFFLCQLHRREGRGHSEDLHAGLLKMVAYTGKNSDFISQRKTNIISLTMCFATAPIICLFKKKQTNNTPNKSKKSHTLK